MKKFPFYKQLDAMDCGSTCLRMILSFYGKKYTAQSLRDKCFITHEGVSLFGISEAAEMLGMSTRGLKLTFDDILNEVETPFIVHWRQRHFIVVYKVDKKNQLLYIADPAHGKVKYSRKEFEDGFCTFKEDGLDMGIALLLKPTPDFYNMEDEALDKTSFTFLLKYLKPYKKYITQLFLGMGLGSLLQLIFPFLTQSLVDVGISDQNISFVWMILIAQLVLFVARTATSFIRSWLMLHISTRINVSIISDFLIKLMKLPIRFFDTKMMGDLLQRINDHQRIEHFLTNATLETIFSLVNLIIFGVVLAIYDLKILLIFLIGSVIHISWILVFMKKRRVLDFKRFDRMSENHNNLIHLISGMQEIKLNNCERQKRWKWENIQAGMFKINMQSLALEQFQSSGGSFINELKNILITFLAASSVINGDITLGMMMSVSYIIGQLNSPLNQLIEFFSSAQDAKISLERMGEIHNKEDEEKAEVVRSKNLPEEKSFKVSNLKFQYDGPESEVVLDDINLHIPAGKVTAIVGASGSGKTTLIKLLLGFYEPVAGQIQVGNTPLNGINGSFWRQSCGVVMQEGFIFNETIAENIAVSDDHIDRKKLLHAVKTANIQEFIETLPLAYNTKIGSDGHGLSQGQKQRVLIARSVYKNPPFLFFDEATNALDANNEKKIMENLEEFYKGKTVVVVAHRLSTVKNADQIVVLDKGKIVEKGTHAELASLKGAYYQLVKNQLELGN